MATKKTLLNESETPTHWYNIIADMHNKPLPPLHPGTREPMDPEALAPLFPMEPNKHEVTAEEIQASLSKLDTPVPE